MSKTVVISPTNYALNRAESITDLETRRAATNPLIEVEKAALLDEAIAFLKAAPSVKAEYKSAVQMRCNGKACPDPTYVASFPSEQRILTCPTCGRENFVPEAYREQP